MLIDKKKISFIDISIHVYGVDIGSVITCLSTTFTIYILIKSLKYFNSYTKVWDNGLWSLLQPDDIMWAIHIIFKYIYKLYHTIVTMMQQWLTGLLVLIILALGEAAFGTLPLQSTTGTVYTILYYMFIL